MIEIYLFAYGVNTVWWIASGISVSEMRFFFIHRIKYCEQIKCNENSEYIDGLHMYLRKLFMNATMRFGGFYEWYHFE